MRGHLRASENKTVYIGTAAWSIPKDYKKDFPLAASQLESYAQNLNAVEINTSFYRDHKRTTFEKWRAMTPTGFRFSVKLSKVFTHEQKLTLKKIETETKATQDLGESLDLMRGLEERLGVVLIQLPPKLSFNEKSAAKFFAEFRAHYKGPTAFEPRHLTWDDVKARTLLEKFEIARVIADPQPYFTRELSTARDSGQGPTDFSQGLVYMRLHGSPEIYKSDYEPERLAQYAEQIKEFVAQGLQPWCIFDNTTFGHATGNALALSKSLCR